MSTMPSPKVRHQTERGAHDGQLQLDEYGLCGEEENGDPEEVNQPRGGSAVPALGDALREASLRSVW